MNLKFSERLGLFKPKTTLPKDEMPDHLRNTLWSIVCDETFGKLPNNDTYGSNPSSLTRFFRKLWRDFFKIPIDNLVISDGRIYPEESYQFIRKWFFDAKWYEVYEYLEFCAEDLGHDFVNVCNPYLQREFSGFRFVGLTLLEINSKEEVIEIEKALNSGVKYRPVKIHLESALALITDKRNPDCRNSIKESISAVESLCKIIVGNDNTTLGQALKFLDNKHNIPKSLKSGFSSIYGYTSENGGIRHGLLIDQIPHSFEEARFMLVACSAFVNYLITKHN